MIDDLLVAHVFLAEIDSLMNHYDVRSAYSKELGRALGVKLDSNLANLAYLAAAASATITGNSGGTAITDADAATNADSLVASIFDLAQAMDEKDIPTDERAVFVEPAQYFLIVNSASKAINLDYSGDGSVATGRIIQLAGMEVVSSNHLGNGDNDNSGPAAYQVNKTNFIAVATHKSALGTVKLRDMRLAIDWDPRRLGWLISASMAVGSGFLRPEAAGLIKTA